MRTNTTAPSKAAPAKKKNTTTASAPIAEKRWVLFNPSREDADELAQAALRQKITVSDFCRNAVERAAIEKRTASQMTFISPVPGGDQWPFSVDLETWFKARDKAEIQGLSVDQWAYLVIRKAVTTTKAPATPKAAKKAPLSVIEFTVSERWVKITATIRDDHFPQFRPEAEADRATDFLVSGYATSLSIHTRAAKEKGRRSAALYDISLDAGRWGYNRIGTLSLKHSIEITFRIKEHDWRQFIADCEFIGHPPEAVIRGAFGARATGAGMPGYREKAKEGGAV